MRRLIALLCVLLSCVPQVFAEDNPVEKVCVMLDARLDYDNAFGTVDKSFNGFKAKYIFFKVNGSFGDSWSYVYRHRLNKIKLNSDFLTSIDFAYLSWKSTEHWSVTAGKESIAIGGYEYDAFPSDLYNTSEFWNNVNCFLFTVGGKYSFNSAKDSFTLQLSESPFRESKRKDIYGLNFLWKGSHGPWSTLYSANYFDQYGEGGMGYVSLGNRFVWGRNCFDLDFQLRTGISSGNLSIGGDFTVVANFRHDFSDKLGTFLKYSHDHNNDNLADTFVMPGTSINNAGFGLEFFPYKKIIRLHLCGNYNFGDNGNPNGALVDGRLTLMLGLTWSMRLFKA